MKKLLISLLLSLFFLSFSPQVYASSFYKVGQGTISPGAMTKVQMKNEKVTLSIGQPIIPIDQRYIPSLPIKVTAQFSMYNTSDNNESIDVLFPTCDHYTEYKDGCDLDHYSNFTVNVNNQKVTTITESTEIIPDNQLTYCNIQIDGKFFKWHQSFPAKQITSVTVTYNLIIPYISGYNGYVLDYILSTGGNWFGNIENGEIIFSAPNPITDEYYKLTSGTISNLSPKLTKSITDNTLSVKITNIKPSVNENLHLFIFNPQDQDVLDLLKEKAKNDNIVSSYLILENKYFSNSMGESWYGPYESEVDRTIRHKSYQHQAFSYFDKAIDLANNFNDLKKITSAIFSIVTPCEPDLRKECITGSGHYFGDYMELYINSLVSYDGAMSDILVKLANKRLSMVTNEDFGIALKNYMTKITPPPTGSTPVIPIPTYSENPIPSCAISASVSSIPSIPTVSPTVIATNAISNKTEVKILWLSIVSLIIILTGLWFFIKKHQVKNQAVKAQSNGEEGNPPNRPPSTEEPGKN